MPRPRKNASDPSQRQTLEPNCLLTLGAVYGSLELENEPLGPEALQPSHRQPFDLPPDNQMLCQSLPVTQPYEKKWIYKKKKKTL